MGLLTSIQNNSYLDQMFEEDTRPGVVASLTASNQANLPFVDRIDALHRLQNCDTIPHGKEISMKPISSKPKQKTPCRNFAKGNCLYGDKCFNLHEKASHPEIQQKPRQDRPPHTPQQRTEPPAPTYNNGTKQGGSTTITHVTARSLKTVSTRRHHPSCSDFIAISVSSSMNCKPVSKGARHVDQSKPLLSCTT